LKIRKGSELFVVNDFNVATRGLIEIHGEMGVAGFIGVDIADHPLDQGTGLELVASAGSPLQDLFVVDLERAFSGIEAGRNRGIPFCRESGLKSEEYGQSCDQCSHEIPPKGAIGFSEGTQGDFNLQRNSLMGTRTDRIHTNADQAALEAS
jgi:hypothetical protein